MERLYSDDGLGVSVSMGFLDGSFVGEARRYEGPPQGGERKTTSMTRSRSFEGREIYEGAKDR